MNKHKKLLFRCTVSSNENEIEFFWALPILNGFELDNIPFYIKAVSCGDIVSADKIDGALYMKELLKSTGHSTVRILFSKQHEIQDACKILQNMGCALEGSYINCLISIDIPPVISYKNVQAYLDDGVSRDKWEYEEGCLGFSHKINHTV